MCYIGQIGVQIIFWGKGEMVRHNVRTGGECGISRAKTAKPSALPFGITGLSASMPSERAKLLHEIL